MICNIDILWSLRITDTLGTLSVVENCPLLGDCLSSNYIHSWQIQSVLLFVDDTVLVVLSTSFNDTIVYTNLFYSQRLETIVVVVVVVVDKFVYYLCQ